MERLLRFLDGLRGIRLWMNLFGLVFGGVFGWTCSYYLLRVPSVVVISAAENDGIAVRGGDLDFIVTKRDNSVCRTSVARWLWRPDPQDPSRPQFRAIISTPYGPPALDVASMLVNQPSTGATPLPKMELDEGRAQSFRLSVPLPTNIEPGLWHPLNVSIDTCGSLTSTAPRFTQGPAIRIGDAR